MAAKKKSTGGSASALKALAGIEKAQKALDLNIKNLKTAMGHIHHSRTKGHIHKPGTGTVKGHIHKAGAGTE
jgi:hypothetical protein